MSMTQNYSAHGVKGVIALALSSFLMSVAHCSKIKRTQTHSLHTKDAVVQAAMNLHFCF